MDDLKLCQSEELKHFLSIQCDEIQKHKWIESEKAGYDLGCSVIKEWITSYAKKFSEL